MRLHYISLLVAGAFFGSAKANSVATDSTPSTAASLDSLTTGKDDEPVLRFLRTTGNRLEAAIQLCKVEIYEG